MQELCCRQSKKFCCADHSEHFHLFWKFGKAICCAAVHSWESVKCSFWFYFSCGQPWSRLPVFAVEKLKLSTNIIFRSDLIKAIVLVLQNFINHHSIHYDNGMTNQSCMTYIAPLYNFLHPNGKHQTFSRDHLIKSVGKPLANGNKCTFIVELEWLSQNISTCPIRDHNFNHQFVAQDCHCRP